MLNARLQSLMNEGMDMAKEQLRSAVARSDAEIACIANEVRHDIVAMLGAAGSGHPGGSLSSADIMATLFYSGVLGWDPRDAKNPDRDRFILSKGHAAPTLYAILAQQGYIDRDELMSIRKLGSPLQGHPDCIRVPAVEVSTGSLGQGLSISCGMAIGLSLDAKAEGGEPSRVFCLLGDGELQEGENWEAAMFASSQNLGNLIALVDYNDLQIDGRIDDVCGIEPLERKFEAFGWRAMEADGHSIPAIRAALNEAVEGSDAPTVVVFRTIKGKGVSFMEDQVGWHGVAPNAEQTAAALAEIDAEGERLAAAAKEAQAR